MQVKNLDFIDNKYIKEEKFLKSGDILNGNIIYEDEQNVTVQFENKNLILPKEQIQGRLGESVSFEVLEIFNNKLNLKQIYTEQNNYSLNVTSLGDEILTINNEDIVFDNSINYKNFLSNSTNFSDSLFILKELKENLNHISNAFNEQSIENMLKDALDPEKNNMITMSDFIKKSFGVDLDNSETENTNQEKYSNIKLDLNMNGIDEEAAFNFEEILTSSGLPITKNNINSLKSIQEKFENLGQLSDTEIYSLIKKEGNITLEDLYTAKHSGFSNLQPIELPLIENIDEQINNILSDQGIQFTEQNLILAKNFIKNQIELSFENFEKYSKLSNIQDNFDLSNILEKSATNIGLNKSLTSVELFDNSNFNQLYSDYKDLTQILPNVKVETIQSLINNNIDINLKNIQEEYNNFTYYDNVQISQDAITQRLNLAKIQMKLTTEAIYRLSNSSININTKPLQNVIEILENMEIEHYKDVLKFANVATTNENVGQIQRVFNSISEFYPKAIYYSTFKQIISEDIDFSISAINESIKSKNIFETFETFKTVPDVRFGDKISKLDSEFEKILIKNGFEITDANFKAAKILTLSNMDFTEENLLNVKLIDQKIDYIYNNLHPIIASNMIKDGFNPMEQSIDQLIQYIDDFSSKFGQTSKEKIAEQILQLDNKNELSKEERSAVIAIYRMLSLVERNNSSSIGVLLKSEKNVTLGNLLEASKTFKKFKYKNNVDFKIDNSTEIKQKVNSNSNISDSIEKGIESYNLQYNKLILGKIIDNATPEKILEVTKNSKDITIEKIYENIKNQENVSISSQKLDDIIEKSRNINDVSQDVLNYMIKNDIAITMNNIINMNKIINDLSKNSDTLEDFKNELILRNLHFGESIFTSDEQKSTLDQALNSVNQLEVENDDIFYDILNLDDLDDIKYMILKNKNVSSTINFIKDINIAKNGVYTLPFKLSSGKITDLNMVVLNEQALNEKNVNLFLQFQSNFEKNLQAYIKVTEQGSIVNITSNNERELENIQSSQNDILNILEKFDIKPSQIIYSTENTKDIFTLNGKDEVIQKLENLDGRFETLI